MAFHRLAQLIRLDLSACQISVIESGAFEGLLSLQRVYLHANHLSTISANNLPSSLHGISVHDNRYMFIIIIYHWLSVRFTICRIDIVQIYIY